MTHFWLPRCPVVSLGIIVAMGSMPCRAQDSEGVTLTEGWPSHIEIDLAKFKGDIKVIRVPAAWTEKHVVVTVTGAWRCESLWPFVFDRLQRLRRQLELGVEHPRGLIRLDLRRRQRCREKGWTVYTGETTSAYEEAKRYIELAKKGPETFLKDTGLGGDPQCRFDVTPQVGAERTIRIASCYRPEDVQRLMDVLTRACKAYVAFVDKTRRELEEERAAIEKARKEAAVE